MDIRREGDRGNERTAGGAVCAGSGDPRLRVRLLAAEEVLRQGLEGMLAGAPWLVVAEPAAAALLAGREWEALLRDGWDPAPPARVVLVLDHDGGIVRRASRMGIGVFVSLADSVAAITDAVRAAVCQQEHCTAAAAELVGRSSLTEWASRRELTAHLTEREREVAALYRRGMTRRQIAFELSIADETVKSHLEHVFRKLGIHRKVELYAFAFER
jgi:DNA-binding NarL/FixJ family response regulator